MEQARLCLPCHTFRRRADHRRKVKRNGSWKPTCFPWFSDFSRAAHRRCRKNTSSRRPSEKVLENRKHPCRIQTILFGCSADWNKRMKTKIKALRSSAGKITVDDALLALKSPSKISAMRKSICTQHSSGMPEVIYGAGKTAEQMIGIAGKMQLNGQTPSDYTTDAVGSRKIKTVYPMDYHVWCQSRHHLPVPDADGPENRRSHRRTIDIGSRRSRPDRRSTAMKSSVSMTWAWPGCTACLFIWMKL